MDYENKRVVVTLRFDKNPIDYLTKKQLPAFSQAERTYYAVPELQLGKC